MVKILYVSITELILQAKEVFPDSSLFHWMPCLHLKRYQPDSFSYRILKVSPVFRHSFRLLFWKMSENELGQPLCLPLLLKKRQSRLIYYRLYILKTTWGLIIKNVWHISVDIMETIWNLCLRCRGHSFLWIYEHNVPNKQRYFGYKNNLYGTKGTFIV